MKKIWIYAAIAVLLVVGSVFAYPKAEEGIAYIRALQSYVYGFPLVMMDLTRQVMTAAPSSGELSAPINQFQRLRAVVPWNFNNVVRISTNSLWSTGFLDLAKEPMIVSFPDGKGIPCAWRALNMWTDVLAVGGTRHPDSKAGDSLFAGPGWNGTPPSNITKVFHSSTRYAWFMVEMSAAGPEDFPRIHALQDQLKITPLSAWGTSYAPPSSVQVDPGVDLTATPYDQVRLMTGEMFFKRLAMALKDNPPYPGDTAAIDRLKKLGVEPGKEFDPEKLDMDQLRTSSTLPPERH